MQSIIRIGTRDSQLAVWQATRVKQLLAEQHIKAVLVPIKSEGDIDLVTPLYAMGVQGIFTRSLDIALLKGEIDLAVHSMKDVPVQLPQGIVQAAVLKRDNPLDLLVYRKDASDLLKNKRSAAIIASSSLRRKAQWLHRFPQDGIEPFRGNVNTRLKKLEESRWDAAIFAAAGLERIGLRPVHAVELNWMIPAPAQGAILVVCGENNEQVIKACSSLNDPETAFCTKIERDFLSALMGGCSTPIGALATIEHKQIFFKGNLLTPDGVQQSSVEKYAGMNTESIGRDAAEEILAKGGRDILDSMHHV